MNRLKLALTVITALSICAGGYVLYRLVWGEIDIYVPMFADHCADCHGSDLKGTPRGDALVDRYLEGGDSIAGLMHSIRNSHPGQAFTGSMPDNEVKGLAMFVGERRLGQVFSDFRFEAPINVPETAIDSEEHAFRIETFATDLHPLTFSIDPLPDGSWLLTEREQGLSLISPAGEQSDLIEGTPELGEGAVTFRGLAGGVGWLLDVAAHPDYRNNGWIYLHYTDLCKEACTGASAIFPASMNKLDRGRIRDGKWVDVETLWQAPTEFYSTFVDTAAGGRLTFDDAGHVFLSVGFKEALGLGAQDLNKPYGKIHRLNDDGTIPPDNPFVLSNQNGTGESGALIHQSIWTYGHRTPQGLEWNPARGRAWNAEMGPRGGDEINELIPGRNYGWPYHSLGMEYTGFEVSRYRLDDTEFDAAEVEQTLVDFTPSPALSSFAFYQGEAFPAWQNNLLLGTLKGSSLYRLVFDGNTLLKKETLFSKLARIRDIEIGNDGLPYLLLESKGGSMIVRLVPEETAPTSEVQAKNQPALPPDTS